jgi:hypothetical protein
MILLADDVWEIRNTQEKGRGLFAKKDIEAGTVIGDYIGKVLKTAEDDTLEKDNNLYLMYYHDRASLYPLDTDAPGVHLINHSCAPNSWMYTYKGHTLFFTLRHIFKGEELTASYLLSPYDEFCNPCNHACKCGLATCTNTMHLSKERYEKWSKFSELEAKKTKKKRVRYGHELAKLSSYPDEIPDNPIYALFGSFDKPPKILNDTKLPSNEVLRRLIRQTGLTLEFPNLKKKVLGVQGDYPPFVIPSVAEESSHQS